MILHLSINNIFKVETVHRIFLFLLHQFLKMLLTVWVFLLKSWRQKT